MSRLHYLDYFCKLTLNTTTFITLFIIGSKQSQSYTLQKKDYVLISVLNYCWMLRLPRGYCLSRLHYLDYFCKLTWNTITFITLFIRGSKQSQSYTLLKKLLISVVNYCRAPPRLHRHRRRATVGLCTLLAAPKFHSVKVMSVQCTLLKSGRKSVIISYF